jgi:uncharacterized surface protein with fasciclin (FAS1) repeats
MQKKYQRHQGPDIRSTVVAGLLGLVSLLGWTACTKTYSTATDTSIAPTQASQSLLNYLKNNYAFSIFYAGLQKAGLDKQITDDKKFTLLIPDNNAFGRVGITQDSVMKMDTAYLRKWLGFHLVQGAIGYDSVPQTVDNAYFSILGQKIFFSRPIPSRSNGASSGQQLHINGDTVNNFDIKASNGFIQVLNTPLHAPLEGNLQDYINAHLDQYSLFKACLSHFNLWDNLKNDSSSQLTVFAPINAVFANIPIHYHNKDTIYNITDSLIATWDTTVIPKAVFAVYMLPSRIFTTDYTDAPPDAGNAGIYATYIFPDRSADVVLPYYGQGINASLLTNYQYQLKGGNQGNLVDPRNLVTVNGNNVLQTIDHVLMIP